MPEREPKFGPVKEEWEIDDLHIKEIGKHLYYRKEKMLSLAKDEKQIPDPKDREVIEEFKEYIKDYYEKAAQQLKDKEPGKELLEVLKYPTKEEENYRTEIRNFQALLNSLTPEEKKGLLENTLVRKFFFWRKAL